MSDTDSFHDCAESEQFIVQLTESRDRAELRAERLEEAPSYGEGFTDALERAASLAELYDTGKQAADALRLTLKVVREESRQNHNESVMDSAGVDCERCGDDVPCWLGEGPSSCLLAVRACRCTCHRTWSTGARCLCCAPPAGWHLP